MLKAQITDCESFQPLVTEVDQQAHGPQATEVIVLADGEHWIWNLVQEHIPHAVQILDFSHAKHYLWEAAKVIYGETRVCPALGQRTRNILFADKVSKSLSLAALR